MSSSVSFAIYDKEELEEALLSASIPSNIENEKFEHVLIADRLVQGLPGHQYSRYFGMSQSGISEFRDQLMGLVDQETLKLMDYFLVGRPIFGKRFQIEDPAFYGYLTLEEAEKLEVALSAFELPDVDSDEWDELPLEKLSQPDHAVLQEFLQSLRFAIDNDSYVWISAR